MKKYNPLYPRSLNENQIILFQTERLFLTLLSIQDLSDLYQVLSNETVRHPVAILPKAFDLKEAEAFIHHATQKMKETQEFCLSVWDATHQYIGYAGLHPTNHAHELEIGYWLAESEWGKGYATELTQGLLTFAFQRQSVTSVIATTALDNTASQRVLEKCGFRREGCINRNTRDLLMCFVFTINWLPTQHLERK